MKLTVLVSEVASCSVDGCGYNVDSSCHARAITVGDDGHAQCDTFVARRSHTRSVAKGGVGACKVTSCRFNRDLECEADAIQVVDHDGHADCSTFAR